MQPILSVKEMKGWLEKISKTAIFGFFEEEDMIDDTTEGYAIDAWGQFLAAADSLRG